MCSCDVYGDVLYADLESTRLQSGENPLVDYYKRKILVLMFLYIGLSTLFVCATTSTFGKLSSAQLRRIYR
jgi:hypothetical protein